MFDHTNVIIYLRENNGMIDCFRISRFIEIKRLELLVKIQIKVRFGRNDVDIFWKGMKIYGLDLSSMICLRFGRVINTGWF